MKLAAWILGLALTREEEREMILGDLQEQLPRRGRWWCVCAAAGIAVYALGRRSGAPRPPHPIGESRMTTWLKDVRYAWRGLWQRPLMTLTIAGTLALGLGANAAIFNLIDRLVLRPFPFADPDRVVTLAETGPELRFVKESVSPANFLDWRRQAETLTDLSAMSWWDANLVDRQEPERVQGSLVSASYFDALDVHPVLGRGFVSDDETFGRHHVVVISDALWRRRFAADPAIVGRKVVVDGEPFDVIGVAPPRFNFPDGAELCAPLAFDPKTTPPRDKRWLSVVARVGPGHTLDEAAAEMNVIATRLAQQYPDANRDHGVRTYTLSQGMMGEGLGPLLSMWQASALMVLLIACANVANLLLARAVGRRRDVAVRLALGASRPRIVRELLTESLLLAGLAVPPAIGVAWAGLRVMRMTMPANIVRFVPGWEAIGPDFRLLAFTLILALVTASTFGLLPSLQASRALVSETLKEGGRTSTGRPFLRRALVVAEIAIALPLLVAAGLGVIGTHRFLHGPQGYEPDGLLTMRLVLPDRTYPDAAARRHFVHEAVDAVAALPGVTDAAAVNNMPGTGSNASRRFEVDGHPPPDPGNLPSVDYRVTTPGYLSLMRIPLVRGRGFTAADREDAAPVVIVSESMARSYWPNEDPVGRRLRVGDTWMTVVGVCGDVIHDWFMRRNAPTLYRPIDQSPSNYFGITVRTTGDPAAAAGAVRQALLRIDPTQPVFEMMTMRRQLHERTIGLQYLAGIMGTFATLGVVLAAVGLYAVIAYFVAQRRHEIGLRLALGATRADVLRMTVGQAFRLALAGTLIGLGLALALSRVMESAMLGIATSDARVFAGFAATLMAVALLAAYLPARRAAAIDPMIALRGE